MKKLALLSLPLLLAACGGGSAPGASVVTATADKTAVTLSSADTAGTTTFTFTNKAGSRETTINSATLTWTDPTTKASTSQTVNLAGFTLPAGLSCAASAANPSASCNFNDAGTTFADRTLSRSVNDAELFGKVLAANPSVTGLPVTVQFNNTQNALPFTFSSAATTGGGGGSTPAEKAPAPMLTVNTTGTQPYSGSLSLTVAGNFDVTSTVKRLVLEVTDSKGNVDNTTYTSSNPTATFSIDTSKYADGPLTFKAIALTESNLRGESAAQTVQIQNVSAPSMTILSPDAGATITGPTTVRVQLRQSTSAYALKPLDASGNDVRIDVRDFRGQIVKTVFGKAVRVSEGILEAFVPLDLIGPEFSSNTYTITATAHATLADGTTRTLSSNTNISTQVSDNKPPALSILMPAYISDPFNTDARATFSRKSALMIQASDDNGVSSIRVDFVCDPATALATQVCPAAPYSYNFPVGVAGKVYRVFSIGAQLDGQPYVQDGNYTLRVTAFDGSNANIQEFPIKVARTIAATTIGGISPTAEIVTTVVADSAPGALNPTSATWTLPGTATHIRYVKLFYFNDLALEIPSEVAINTEAYGINLTDTITFNEEGSYRMDYVVEDLDTGVVRYYQGTTVKVKKNPS